jgi:WD40 repeat protein
MAYVWNIGEIEDMGKQVFALRGHHDEVLRAAFSPKGDEIITASQDGTARLWTLNFGTELSGRGQLGCRREPIVISPDHKLVLTIRDAEVLRHDNHENRDLPPLRGHGATVESVVFSSDGTQIVTAGGVDNTARIWDARTGNLLKILAGHEAWVLYAEFNQTGDLVVTASGDGTARVWDSIKGQNDAIFGRGGKPLSCARFSAANTSITTEEYQTGFLRRYNCKSCQSFDQLLPAGEEKVRERPLSPDEEHTFLHN